MSAWLSVLFGCRHPRTTFPLTRMRPGQGRFRQCENATYISCLDCGAEIAYSWVEMRRLPHKRRSPVALLVRRAFAGERTVTGSGEYQPEFETFTR